MTAEHVDTMTRREDDGGHGYDDGAATGASAMVGNGEGRDRGNGMSRGFGVRRGGAHASRARVASR